MPGRLFAIAVTVCLTAITAATPAVPPVISVGRTQLHICSDTVIRVTHTPTDIFPNRTTLIAKQLWEPVKYTKIEDSESVTVVTGMLRAVVDKTSGIVTFFDAKKGNAIVVEHSTTFNATQDMGKDTYVVEQSWLSASDEALYGGGEFQNGLLNFKGAPVQLVQYNTEAIVPFFVSSKGYGLLWDNYAWSYLNPVRADSALNFGESEADHMNARSGVSDGDAVALRACDASDPQQHWTFNVTDGTLRLSAATTMLLDIDFPKNDVHIWHRDTNFDGNQQFTRNGTLLVSTAHQLCLKSTQATARGQITMGACDTSDVLQQWHLDSATGLLSLASSHIHSARAAARGGYDFGGPEGSRSGALCLMANPTVLPAATAQFTPTTTGVHHFYIDACPGGFGCGGGKTLKLWIDGTNDTENDMNNTMTIIEWDALSNLPNSITGRATLQAKKTYRIAYFYKGFEQLPPVYVQPASYDRTTIRSMVGDLVDYYFTWGGSSSMDGAISGYREVTGAAPLYNKKVYGFWQCKEHYATQEGLLEAAHGFRNRSIPVDSIVQDWHYWGGLGWGPQWDPAVYPDPAGMVKELDDIDIQLMVSVWSKFDTNTKFFKTMTDQGQMLNGTSYYDAWNAAAREQFYQFSHDAMFNIGVAALWLDATEPEGFPNVNHNTALGSGNALMNSYSLMTTKAIADGLRRDYNSAQGARVFTLTRSSFAAQQTTGATLWSGDISGAWDSLRRQVTASLNYQLSGIPYWSEDIGGFFRPGDQYSSADYHDMLVRWFQFGCFTPIYRVHGGGSNTEMWNYGDAVMARLNATNNLRYRLLPYTYSGFHRVETEGYTMQRAMVFDHGAAYASVGDQFSWGESFLVAPVVSQADNVAALRDVALPPGSWRDFWTGKSITGGSTIRAAAPIDHAPLFVRAGSIVPMGPYLQHANEKAADPLELRVYVGGDAEFVLYEDDGHSRDYQTGKASTIRFSYNNANGTLSFGARSGSFDGMLHTRTVRVVFVAEGHGVGLEPEGSPDHVVTYSGAAMTITK